VTLAVGGLSALALAPSAAGAATSPTTASVISTAKNAKLGTILVSGTTVYALKPSKTACTAACLKAWPPVVLPSGVTAATAGTGVDASKLGTVATADGALQITYAGKRLYWFAKDKAPGQVKGNLTDKWGKWYTMVTAKSSSGSKSPSTTNSGTGGTGF
jgi:predicted lipoprotein with Yx(FWY)xxD motif